LGHYLDTSFLGGLFIEAYVFATRASAFFAEANKTLAVSDFAAAEFASIIARLTRMTKIKDVEARAIFAGFDAWRSRFADEEDVVSFDIQAAASIIRRLDLNLRAPDAINLAIARRLGASLVTFDRRMADNARALGIAVAAV
jgi:predicted nucleic acid-binding protein